MHAHSEVQEGDQKGKPSSRRASALPIVGLALLLFLSPLVVYATYSSDASPDHISENGARIALIDMGPTLVANPSTVLVGELITFCANASSDDAGATLVFTIFYDYYQSLGPVIVNPNSSVTINTTGSPGSVITTYAYDHPGNLTLAGEPYFWVKVFVNDGMDNVSADTQVFVSSPSVNTPPYFLAPPDSFNASAGSSQDVIIKIADDEGDIVTVFWDFGDGTNATNVTVAPPGPLGVVLGQTHSWNPRVPGKGGYNQTYILTVSLSDGLHPPVNSSTPLTIIVPVNKPPVILYPGITASKNSANPMDLIRFTASASDNEGDPLTWTYDYSDGCVEVYNTSVTAPGLQVWQNTTHSFTAIGNYTVELSVSDALMPNQTGSHNITVTTVVRISANIPPTALALNVEPSSPVINATRGYVNVTLSIQAWDLNGDNFTLSWDLGVFGTRSNSSVGDAAQRIEPYTFRQQLTINETGSYHFEVTVTDGLPGHEVRLTAVANISSTNEAPVIREFNHAPYSLGDFAAANDSIAFRLVVTDRESDVIEIIWDFGDGSARLCMNRTDFDAMGNLTVLVNHTYVLKGFYNVTVIVTDNKIGGYFNHTLTTTMPIQVSVRPPPIPAIWTTWDSISLSIFVTVPVLLVLWGYSGMYRRRREEMAESPEQSEKGSSVEGGPEGPPLKGNERGG